jgi:hypothetical protein
MFKVGLALGMRSNKMPASASSLGSTPPQPGSGQGLTQGPPFSVRTMLHASGFWDMLASQAPASYPAFLKHRQSSTPSYAPSTGARLPRLREDSTRQDGSRVPLISSLTQIQLERRSSF